MKNIFKDRRFKHGSLATVMTVGLVVVVVLANTIVGMLADRFPMDVDLTTDNIFEITEESINYVKGLDKNVAINVLAKEDEFAGNNAYYKQANEVIQKYAKYSNNIKINYVDIYANPEMQQKYPKETLSYGEIIVECGERNQKLTAYDLFNTQTDQQTGRTSITSSKAEQAMTSAIMNVTNADPPTVVVLKGYGVTDVSAYTSLLSTNGYVVSETDLLTGEIDQETDMLILAAPTTDLSDEVLKKLDAYLDNNGRFGKNFLYLASASQPTLPNLEEFLSEWGVTVGEGYLMETDASKIYFDQNYTMQQYGDEDYTKKLSSTQYPVMMYASRPLSSSFGESGTSSNRSTKVLLKTYDNAVIVPKAAMEDGSEWTPEDGEKDSYATVIAGSRLKYDGTTPLTSTVIVAGSVDFIHSNFLSYSALNNADYAVNMANTVCNKKDGISIVSKTVGAQSLGISEQQAKTIGGIAQFALPVLVLILGGVIWVRRRNR